MWNFENLIKPHILKWLNLKRVWATERQETELQKILDMKKGQDYTGLTQDDGVITIANRVQWRLNNGKPWDTFTIRKERFSGAKTEYIKKLEAIAKGYEYPAYNVQAYVTERRNGKLLSVALCKTLELIDYISKNPEQYKPTSNAEFYFAPWYDFKKNYWLKTWFKPTNYIQAKIMKFFSKFNGGR